MSDAQTVYIAFGGNVGDREANLRAALQLLREHVQVEAVSSLYETEPAYVLDQPRFLNGVLRGATRLEPMELLRALKEIEAALGRRPGLRNGPRPVDLDILRYGDVSLATPELTIPHPRIAERPFVLVPLAEIAPELAPAGVEGPGGEVVRRIEWDPQIRN
jgi:2-amino-4-hydroxy-6-hydroxymethyldihydropteridine diphosphokinase